MHTYISYDLETTGLSPVTNEIVEIGAWKVVDDLPVEKFVTLVKPQGYYGRDIQKLTGITLDMLQDACTLDEIMPSFIQFCGDLPLLGYGLSFDYEFICNKAKPMGYDFSLSGERTGIDVLFLCRKYYRNKSHKLCDMAKFLNISLRAENLNYHRAEYDAYVTKLVYDRFLCTSPTLPNVEVPVILGKADKALYGKAENYGTLEFE